MRRQPTLDGLAAFPGVVSRRQVFHPYLQLQWLLVHGLSVVDEAPELALLRLPVQQRRVPCERDGSRPPVIQVYSEGFFAELQPKGAGNHNSTVAVLINGLPYGA